MIERHRLQPVDARCPILDPSGHQSLPPLLSRETLHLYAIYNKSPEITGFRELCLEPRRRMMLPAARPPVLSPGSWALLQFYILSQHFIKSIVIRVYQSSEERRVGKECASTCRALALT